MTCTHEVRPGRQVVLLGDAVDYMICCTNVKSALYVKTRMVAQFERQDVLVPSLET